MSLSDRSGLVRLGVLVVAFSLMTGPGNRAVASEEDHGNPGRFIENIRKGLSGLSKYFWSPFGEPETEKATAGAAVPDRTETGKTSAAPAGEVKPATDTTKRLPDTAIVAKETPKTAREKSTASKSAPSSSRVAVAASKEGEPEAKPNRTAPKAGQVPKESLKKEPTKEQQKPSGQNGLSKEEPVKKELARERKPSSPDRVEKALQAALARNNSAPASPSKTEKKVTDRLADGADRKDASKAAKPDALSKAGKTAASGQKPVRRETIVKKETARAGTPKLENSTIARGTARGTAGAGDKNTGTQADRKKDAGPVASAAGQTETGGDKTALRTDLRDKAREKNNRAGSQKPAGRKFASKGETATPAVSARKEGRKEAANDRKGTYIWVPGRGSPLIARFGLTGIPADRLAERGDLERTDGRWVFAPYRPGVVPGLYGLGDSVRAAEDGGVWVGSGRNWVYVFDRKRTYSSFFETQKQAVKKVTDKTKVRAGTRSGGKAAAKESNKKADKEQEDNKSSDRTAISTTAEKPDEGSETAKAESGEGQSDTSKAGASKATDNRNVADKKDVKAQVTRSATDKTGKTGRRDRRSVSVSASGEARNKGTKARDTARAATRSGNWTHVNGRWVYVPEEQNRSRKTPVPKEMEQQVATAPVTGGWVQRNGLWVYVAPQNKKAGSPARPVKKATGSQGTTGSGPVGVTPGKLSDKTRTSQARPLAQNDRSAQKPLSGVKLVAEAPQKGQPDKAKMTAKAPGDQRVWVRENNRWVYVRKKAQSATGQVKAQERKPALSQRGGLTGAATQPLSRQTGAVGAQAGQAVPSQREFYFFVPGQAPGTGNWYAAPVELMKKARRLSPSGGANRQR